jgi:hypothetical protein
MNINNQMKSNRWTIENALYALALILALVVRLVALKAAALNDVEAGWALQALGLARGQAIDIGPQPLYVLFTGLLFSILGSDNFLARLLPALAGSLLVLFPFLMRPYFGKRAALILSFGLALDPALVFLSRTAGSQMPALSFGLLALAAAFSNRPAWTGLFAGLALLTGPQVLAGTLGIGLAWIVGRLLENAGILQALGRQNPAEQAPDRDDTHPEVHAVRLGLAFMAGTLLVAGTLFFHFPQGIGALADILPTYLRGWTSASGVPALRLPLAWIVYVPLVFFFSLAGVARAWAGLHPRYNPMRWLSLWAFFALAVAMLYPDRQVSDLSWALVPLWALTSMEIVRDLDVEAARTHSLISLGEAALIFLLLAFAWFALAGLSHFTGDMLDVGLRSALILVIGAGALAAVTTMLVALGWNWLTARRGLVWGLVLTCGLYMLSAMWGSAGLRAGGGQDLWSTAPQITQAGLLSSTISDLSEWNTGQNDSLQIISLVDYPSLKWVLRNWPETTFTSQLPAGELPAIIITSKDQSNLAIAQSYRGHEFVWEYAPDWQGVSPPDFPAWLAFRDAPVQQIPIILWARTNLFSGGQAAPGSDASNPNTSP